MFKQDAIEDLKTVKKVLDNQGIPFYLVYGTALGAYRDGDFLPDDDDIDLAIVGPVDFKLLKKTGWMLYDLGFEPQQIGWNVFGRLEPCDIGYNGLKDTGIIPVEKKVNITIFYFNFKENCERCGEEYVVIPKIAALKLISSPIKFYKKYDTVKFCGEKFWVPHPIEEYLEFCYEDWKNPLKRDHGKTYFEMHPEKEEMIDISNKQAVFKGKMPPRQNEVS